MTGSLLIVAALVPAFRSWKRRERETAGRTLAPGKGAA